MACLANLAFVVFGLIGLAMTGYAFDSQLTNPTAWLGRIVIVGVAAFVAATVSYVAAQRQQGQPIRLTDPSHESPPPKLWPWPRERAQAAARSNACRPCSGTKASGRRAAKAVAARQPGAVGRDDDVGRELGEGVDGRLDDRLEDAGR